MVVAVGCVANHCSPAALAAVGPWRSQSKATATLVIDAPVRDGVEVLNTADG
jgi:hypothetical protein